MVTGFDAPLGCVSAGISEIKSLRQAGLTNAGVDLRDTVAPPPNHLLAHHDTIPQAVSNARESKKPLAGTLNLALPQTSRVSTLRA